MNRLGFIFSSFLVVLALASSMLFVVDQRQFGVVYALGQIKEVITEPGLNFKLPPPFQNVSYIDKRLLTLETSDTEPMLTAEKQRVVIDWYVRWRISEPTQYIRNVGLTEADGPISSIASCATRSRKKSTSELSRSYWRPSEKPLPLT
jgi:membrane protease subunit HflC